MLVGLGIALIALASVFRDAQTVAPVFAFMGVVAVVLGVFFSRLEGELQVGVTQVKAFLRDAQRLVEREDLEPDELRDVLQDALSGGRRLSRRDSLQSRPAKSRQPTRR